MTWVLSVVDVVVRSVVVRSVVDEDSVVVCGSGGREGDIVRGGVSGSTSASDGVGQGYVQVMTTELAWALDLPAME